MTREEAKELLPIIQAFAEGKIIQFRTNNRSWVDLVDNDLEINVLFEYRIKPEPRYRPFKTQEECWEEMLKHQPFGYIKRKALKNIVFITEISTSSTHNELYFSLSHTTSVYDAVCLFDSYTFTDGTPFGIKEE